jgi:serine/threonine-protein kinase
LHRSARDIAGYRLVAGLGEGGMARVYLALSKKAAGFSKLVVLKVIRSSVTHDPELRRMFFDEARVAALLSHPNVVQTYEAGEDEGRLFLAMEYLEGKSLSSMTAQGVPRLALEVHLRIIADMLAGLHYAHGITDVDGQALDVVHRDVSPQNVFVTFAGQSKVVDFGIAKIAGSPATQSGIIKGKVGYIAPEQIHNKNVDRRADVF